MQKSVDKTKINFQMHQIKYTYFSRKPMKARVKLTSKKP